MNYILGPGDELQVSVRSTGYNAVSVEGKVSIQNVGEIFVSEKIEAATQNKRGYG
jgi:protein involved in polysaccharide export with SLBB domain